MDLGEIIRAVNDFGPVLPTTIELGRLDYEDLQRSVDFTSRLKQSTPTPTYYGMKLIVLKDLDRHFRVY